MRWAQLRAPHDICYTIWAHYAGTSRADGIDVLQQRILIDSEIAIPYM